MSDSDSEYESIPKKKKRNFYSKWIIEWPCKT
jgi:hypothetical protein